jgi:hypothetical protein
VISAEGNATSRISCVFRITILAVTQPGRITGQRDLWPTADRPAGAFRSELPIAWDREFTSRDYRNNGPATTGERSLLEQVRALPAGEAGPSAWSARANTNAQARFQCWRRPALATSPKTQACIVCSELAATVSIWACRTRHTPPTPPPAALAECLSQFCPPFTGRPVARILPQAAGRPRIAGVIRDDAGVPGAPPREPARRDVVATARIRSRRPGQIGRGRGFLDHQQPDISSAAPLRWRNHIFCAAGA